MLEGATVFVVDDDDGSRKSVRCLVEPMGVAVELFSSAEEFLDAYDPSQPGCLVTDLRMLGMSGLDLQEELKRRGVQIPTIVMSGYADVSVTVRAMQQGALTLLEKPCRNMELWDAIQKALELNEETHAENLRRREVEERLQALTQQEREILDSIVAGIPNKTIAKNLDISLRTVEARRKTIFQKMKTHSVAELVQAVMLLRISHESPTADTAVGRRPRPR